MVDPQEALFERIDVERIADPAIGNVRWSARKSFWWSGMFAGWLVLGSLYFSWPALAVFFVTSGITLCLGHSLGMHRKFIHRSFDCPTWLEMSLVYMGTLVGLGGPFMMMYTHDLRDWAQRQSKCHDFLSHQRGILTDFWWQLHCDLYLEKAPTFRYPSDLATSRFYRFIERTSMLQQLPLALLLFAAGGWGWVAWGACARVTVSIFGHWFIGHFAHNTGHRDWHVEGAAVQGFNVRCCGLITFGECWHNNHHAFPGSAKLGLYRGQFDPGWLVLKLLKCFGLVSGLKEPKDLALRPELTRIEIEAAVPSAASNYQSKGSSRCPVFAALRVFG